MATYVVTVSQEQFATFTVEADSVDEAWELGENMADDGRLHLDFEGWASPEVVNVERSE